MNDSFLVVVFQICFEIFGVTNFNQQLLLVEGIGNWANWRFLILVITLKTMEVEKRRNEKVHVSGKFIFSFFLV